MTHKRQSRSIAYFVSPHGFGHAARASAVMRAIQDRDPSIGFDIFTTIPRWFFEDSLARPFRCHSFLTDIGLVQETSLRADLDETVRQLDRFIPFDEFQIRMLAEEIDRLKCELVMCDIAPMGIAVAREAGVPSLLVENFTWDWVYEEYVSTHERLRRHADYLGSLFADADYHVQANPVCSAGRGDLSVPPVSRRPVRSRRETRDELGVPEEVKLLLVTMGGIREIYGFLDSLVLPEDVCLVIPGGSNGVERNGPVISLPHRSAFFHPDLVNAADAVMGKVGYSTLAEVYQAGVPFGFIKRSHFRESDILAEYIHQYMHGVAISEVSFRSGAWEKTVERLVSVSPREGERANGATQVADFVCDILDGKGIRAE